LEDRFSSYFNSALQLVNEEEEKLKLFARFFTDSNKFYHFLEEIKVSTLVKEKEYIVFYLDLPLEEYQNANERYLKDKLFNTDKFNVNTQSKGLMGTSDFFNGFNSKKPYLLHQSATFQIPGRISAHAARKLYEFMGLMSRKVFPQPLPIFVNQAEAEALQQSYNGIVQLEMDQSGQVSHRKIVAKLMEQDEEVLGNFYLMYYSRGEIKDFDFVPKFQYTLETDEGTPWIIEDLVGLNKRIVLNNLFDLQEDVLPVIFDNSLIVKKEDKPIRVKYFDDIEQKYCKSNGIYLLVMRFRKAFYDFIYKNKRQAVSTQIFHEIMKKGILENIRLDRVENGKHKEEYRIKQKLNIWISLWAHFEDDYQKSKDMVNHISSLRSFMDELASGQRTIATDEEGAFAAGQVIAYLFSKISSDKQPHSQLEPFLRKKSDTRFKEDLVKLFERYKHVNHTKRFSQAFSQVLACEWDQPVSSYLPILLSGYFSPNELRKSQSKDNNSES
jgi:CRISPR-associated protein Csh1